MIVYVANFLRLQPTARRRPIAADLLVDVRETMAEVRPAPD
jgi:hypothetical protein